MVIALMTAVAFGAVDQYLPARGSGVAAPFAELAAGLLLTGATIRAIAHGRAPEKA